MDSQHVEADTNRGDAGGDAWEQRPGEPDECYRQLCHYLEGGRGTRSLRRTASALGVPPGTINSRAVRWDWASRSRAFDRLTEDIEDQEHADLCRKVQRDVAPLAELMLYTSNVTLNAALKTLGKATATDGTGRLSGGEAIRAVQAAAVTTRVAAGIVAESLATAGYPEKNPAVDPAALGYGLSNERLLMNYLQVVTRKMDPFADAGPD